MDRSRCEPNGLPMLQPARKSSSPPREMTLQENFRVPLELRPVGDFDDPQSEMTLQEMNRENAFLDELTLQFSNPSPQSGPTPAIEEVRRSPVDLIHRSPPPEKDLRAFVPELNIPLDHVTQLPDGRLEFSKKITGLCAERVILERFPRRVRGNDRPRALFYERNDFTKKAGLKREMNITPIFDSIQNSWLEAGNASPYPTLEAIVVNRGKLLWPPPLSWVQLPESIMAAEGLDWDDCKKLSWSRNISENMIARASVWIDDSHPILDDFEMLSARPETTPAVDANGNNDILRNHLLNRRWTWIARMQHYKRVIDIPRTEEFYDARVAFFDHSSDHLLRDFCQRRQCTQKQMEKRPAYIRGKLEQLMMMSQMAAMKMTTVARKPVEKYGPWLDFVVNSTRDGNDQLSSALQELEVARYFISSVRFAATEDDASRLEKIPEYSDLEQNPHWAETQIKSLSEKKENKKRTWSTRQKEALLNRRLSRRAKPILTTWQLTGKRLYNLQTICPQTEAECALALLLHRQELAVIREQASKEKVSEKPLTPPALARARSCQCPSDMCQYQLGSPPYSIMCDELSHYCSMGSGSSSGETSPISEVNIFVEPPNTSSSGPLNDLPPFPARTALSVISEERSQSITPRLERRSSKITVTNTTHSGQMTPPEAVPAEGMSQQAIITSTAPAGQITPPNDPSAFITVEEDPQQSSSVAQATTRLQNGVAEAHEADDEEEPASFVTPPEIPSTPIATTEVLQQGPSVEPQAIGLFQNYAYLLNADGKGAEVSKQSSSVEPEAIAEKLNGTAEDPGPKKSTSGDSGYDSKDSSKTEDEIKAEMAAVSDTLKEVEETAG